jgi:UMF1 family MFS transporter
MVDQVMGAPAAPRAHDEPLSLGGAAWSLFEGARNPYVILVTIYIFMPYVAATVIGDPVRGQEEISRWSQYSGWFTMATAPFLGASIDQVGRRKIGLAAITMAMAPLMASLWFTKPDGSGLSAAMTLLITSVIGVLFTYSEVLHNSLLVRAAGLHNAHKASGLALAVGNALALIALAFTAWGFALPGHVDWSFVPAAPLFGLDPAKAEPQRVVALMAGAIFAVGAVPFFLFTPDAPPTGVPLPRAFAHGAGALKRMVLTMREHRDAAIYLISRMFYVDGMVAILTFAGVYATGVMKWGALEMLVYGILLTVLAVFGGFVGRWLDAALGAKRAVQVEIGMSTLGIIAFIGMAPDKILYFWPYDPGAHAPLWNGPVFRTLPEWVFILVGFLNATFITAHFASSRTLLTRLTPPDQSGAFFGVYALSATATAWLAPLLVNIGTTATKTQQGGFAMIALLLAIGFIGLLFVRGGNLAPPARPPAA